jgi:hypothetical protein
MQPDSRITIGDIETWMHRLAMSASMCRWFELSTKCQLSDDKYTKQELAEFTDLLNAAKGSPANA